MGTSTDRNEQIVQLLTQFQRRLQVYIRSQVPQRSDAEDVLQEVNLFIWRNAGDFQPGTDFGAWAYRIAHFHILTWRKRMARQKLQFNDELVNLLAAGAPDTETSDRRQDALEGCVAKLPDEDRELVRLRYEVGGTAQVLADTLGRSVKAVYYALNRIHLQLLACIERALRAEAQS